jgi:HD-like signal output (HDOD) protein
LVLGMAVQRNAQLSDPRLIELGRSAWDNAQRSGELARWLANELHLDSELCFTAALLHNIGELALLRSLQDWQDAGGVLRDEDIHLNFQQRAASFGSALRIRWRLPFGLRELIAAFYNLGSGVFSREALVLNLVNRILHLRSNQPPSELREERCVRMLRLDLKLLERLPSLAA